MGREYRPVDSVRRIYAALSAPGLEESRGVRHAGRILGSSVGMKRERLYTGDCPLKIQTGVFYGNVSMIPVSSGDGGVPKYMWIGDAVNGAVRLSGMSEGDIVVDGYAWSCLSADNRRLFRMCGEDRAPVFRGVAKNMAMNNCILRTGI